MYGTFAGTSITSLREVSFSESIETADTSSGSDTDRSHLTTLADASIDITVLDKGTDASGPRQALSMGASGTFDFAPEGTATGKPRFTCVATVVDRGPSWGYESETEISYTLQKDGAWVNHYDNGTGSTTW
jgi:hypothetical protein